MKRLILFNILLCSVVTVLAQGIYEDFHELTKHHIITFSYKGPDGNKLVYGIVEGGKEAIVLPPSGKISEYKYSREYHYYNKIGAHYNFETLVIPEQVSYQGKNYMVTAMHENACDYHNHKLKVLTLPKSIKRFGYASFPSGEIHISDLTAFFSALNASEKRITWLDGNTKLYLNGQLVTHLVLPKTIQKIPKNAFIHNKSLESVVIPNSVTRIGEGAFKESALKKVTIPNSVTSIDEGAFEKSALKKVVIPSSVRWMSTDAFYFCRNLEEAEINMQGSIGRSAFAGCHKLKKVIIGPDVTEIECLAFYLCDSLASVIIMNNPKLTIRDDAFRRCPSLTHVQGLAEHHLVEAKAFRTPDDKQWATPFSYEEYKKTFTCYAIARLVNAIEQWQKKGEFETTTQWQQRVTRSSRDAKVAEVIETLKKEFIAKGKSAEPAAELLTYDADKSVFAVKIGSEKVYVKVPNEEAQQFKSEFNPKGMQTTYDIVNDRLAVVERSYQLDGKTYPTTNSYAKADNLGYLSLNLPPLEVDFGGGSSPTANQPKAPIDLTIDKNIPVSGTTNSNTFAVIIGNENYKSVSKVQYAQNDARSFAEYCKKTLGLPEKNVRGYEDATYGMMVSALQDIQKIAKAYHGDINIIFYYAGHGIPDNASKNAYLLPVDADGRQMDICFPLDKLYQELGALETKSVTVFLDACFSGALRGDGMLMAARTVALKPKPSTPQGKMVVFSAATDEQTAFPYTEKGHGMFTYYLLKKIRDTKGNCTLGELDTYICDEVAKQSIVTNGREQTPTVRSSASIADSWKGLKLK